MRVAEFVMAVSMAIFSIYLMWKSTELPIGWIAGEGPGGGAWPFWLSVIMLICCLVILYRWFKKEGFIATSTDVFMESQVLIDVGLVALSLILTVALFYIIGVYGALPLFIIFFLRFFGKHTWKITGLVTVLTPVVVFLFFEIALKITLPKGYSEPLFFPLYRWLL